MEKEKCEHYQKAHQDKNPITGIVIYFAYCSKYEDFDCEKCDENGIRISQKSI
jgi:hypothetical protein